jgi:hypothetical protein
MSAEKVESKPVKQSKANELSSKKAKNITLSEDQDWAATHTEEAFGLRVTSVRLKVRTVLRLKELGAKGESYDDIVVWLLDHAKRRKR